jgi:uncharacterized protein (TIGR03067 family)
MAKVRGAALADADIRNFRVMIQGDRMRCRNTPAALAIPDSCSVKLDPQKTPKAIDLTWLEGAAQGTSSLGIYQLVNGRLLMALRPPADAQRPRPAGYATVSGTLVSITLERVSDGNK